MASARFGETPPHVVVTGAAGFVGGYLTNWLAERGARVTAVARRPLPEAKTAAGVTWRQNDLAVPSSLPDRFDALVHCAAVTPANTRDAEALYSGNMNVCRNVFAQSVAAGAKTIIFLSSMSVYGSVAVPVVTETTPPEQPDPYGRAKRDSELLLEEMAGREVRSALSIRLPGTVGKGSHGNFLSEALKKVLAGAPVEAKNPDAAFNNIVYVGDLAEFIGNWLADPRPGYNVTNLAATDPLGVGAVLSLLFQNAEKPEQLHFTQGGKQPFLISLDHARALGYRASTVRASVEAMVRDCLS